MQSTYEIWFKVYENSGRSEVLTITRVTRTEALLTACEAWDKLEAGGFYMMSMRPAKKTV